MRSRLLYLLPLLLLPSLAAAFATSSAGNSTTYGAFTAGAGNIGKYAVSTASDGTVLVNSGGRLSVPGGSIPINVTGSIPRPSAAAAVGRFLGKSLPLLGVGVAVYELAQELGFTLDNSGGSLVVLKPNPTACLSNCYEYTGLTGSSKGARPYFNTVQQLAQFYVGGTLSAGNGQCSFFPVTSATGTQNGATGSMVFTCQGGTSNGSVSSRTRAPDPPSNVASSVAELEAAVAAKSGWPSGSALAQTVKDAIAAGDALTVESPVVTGPATAPISTTTTVDPATGNTTTTVVQISNTYSGPTVTTTTTQTTTVTNTGTGAPVGQPTTTTVATPVTPSEESPAEPEPFLMPCGVAGTLPCAVKVDEAETPSEVGEDEFKPLLDEGKQAQEQLLDTVSGDADKSSLFDGFADLFVTPPLADCVPLEIPGDRGSIDPCGTVGGARAIMAYIWALSGLALCLHMVRKAL